MPRPSVEDLHRTIIVLVAAIVGGACAGAAAGWSVVSWEEWPVVATVPVGGQATSTRPTATSTGSGQDVTVIPVERRPQSLLPSPFVERRSSPVAGVYRQDRKANTEGLLTDERLAGQAVAVTSDGWFVIPSSAVEGLRPADLLVAHEGTVATATRMISDRTSGVTFLKTPLGNLSAPAFARAADVTSGLAVWLERRADRVEPTGIIALAAPAMSLDGTPSETVARRGAAVGMSADGDVGAPLWSGNAALIGVVSSAPGASLSYIPSSAWVASLQSLLSSGVIRHAFLGVRAVDLAAARFDAAHPMPERGALLHEDRASKKPAVERVSPAATSGLRAGDVIQSVDRDILDGSADLGELLAQYRPGSHVVLTVLRAGIPLEISVDLGSTETGEEVK